MKVLRTRLWIAATVAVIASMLVWVGPQFAAAFSNAADEPVHADFTLEACRLTAGTTLPIGGKFICPDAMYTTGNLGKSWNELDLVPHRLTSSLGSQSDATTTYKVSLAADGITNGKVGYDVLSDGVVNAAKSDASCTVSSSATATSGTAANSFGGGTDTVIYKDFTIHQNKGTTCVIDWYQRLALTSHLYPGSSLQSYMFSQANFSGGKKTLSIPVNQIEPQSLSKDMAASQLQDFAWNLTKSATPDSVDFANSCLGDGRTSGNVAITVSWTKVAADPSVITMLTHVYATNPSARSIKTTVTDKVYTGSTQTTQVTPTEDAASPTHLTNTVVVPALTTTKIIDFIGTVPAGTAASFNDVATGTYLDEVTNVVIPQTTSATANTAVTVSAGTNSSASIVDTETISSGFHFKLNTVTGTVGTLGGYVLGTSTAGPLVWTSPVLTGNGSVTFNKTITADAPSVVTVSDNKKLSDTANLVGAGGFLTSASAHVDITSGATLNVGVNKTIPSGVTGTQNFTFDVMSGATKLGSIPISITPPATSASGSINVAATGTTNTFTIHEQPTANWNTLADKTVTITLPSCGGNSTYASFTNGFDAGTAKVKKVTVPSGNEAGWAFTLSGPGTPAGGEHVTTTGSGYVNFATVLQQGHYTVTETGKSGFDFTSNSGQCDFTVTYPDDAGHVYACTYTNTQRGSLEVTKTVDWNGVTPDPNQTFEICITGPSFPTTPDCKSIGSAGGKLTWDNLLGGDYVVNETNPGTSWVVSGGDGKTATVQSGDKTTAQGITNTRKLGSLQVTKDVDWKGVTPDQAKTFEICITGPSYPAGNCKSVDFDGGTLTWTNLIPGNYTAAETNPGSSWIVAGSPTGTITVPANGGQASSAPVITNTRKLGSLQVTKSVDWNGATPDPAKTFEICITGPSYPGGNCKSVGFNGGTLTWTNLIPGDYFAAETGPGSSWSVAGSPTGTITVPANGGQATNAPTISNTRKLGSLQVTKTVHWAGVTPDQNQTFEICITGPSFPNGDCKSTGYNGGSLTWTNLVPGSYTAAETDPGSSWTVAGSPTGVILVPSDGGQASNVPVIDNTRKHGSLQVTKNVNWNGVTPDQAKTFEICITGPSYPNSNCKTVGFQGGTLTWGDLIPGDYTATETNPGSSWTVTGSPSATITVPTDGSTASLVPVISNARKLGSLKVTKSVDWNSVSPQSAQSFEICITGPSFPNGDCKSVGKDGGTLTWTDLIPGSYTAAETNPGAAWTVDGSPSGTISVPSDGGQASNVPVITNTRKLGSLKVTKSVNWNGVTADANQTFQICINGPSFPNGDCKSVGKDGGTLTWTDLIPGSYTAHETNPGSSWTVSGSPTGTIAVPTNGGQADNVPVITNTRKLGSLQISKSVNWNGVTPDPAKTFEVCLTGPSYPNANCKTIGFQGGTLTWTDLIPGDYIATETNPGAAWNVNGSPTASITVPADGSRASLVPEITNTRKLGSLKVTKNVEWNGVTPDDNQSFAICITGPSYPTGNCQSVGKNGGTLTWTDLIPGDYTAAETNPGSKWSVGGSPSGTMIVPTDGGQADNVPVITNTRKLGSLQVTKSVNWNGITPDDQQSFEVCITGPSFPSNDCKSIGFQGGTLTWSNLVPGDYTATETDPGSSWTVDGSPSASMTVPADGSTAELVPIISNTRKLGSLQVTKSVNWNGVTPDDQQAFEVCITGPSFPSDPDCQSVGANGGTLTWINLIPGAYSAAETNPGNTWSVAGSPSGTISVPNDGGRASLVPTITNTRKLGSLHVTKHVGWNGVDAIDGQEFSICITGPSFATADCHTFTSPDALEHTWSNLIPGAYTVTEPGLGAEWTLSGENGATVPTDGGTASADVTNTRKHGSLSVTKAVDWNGVTPNENKTFSICIKGPSFPDTADCKTVDFDGGTVTWTDLIPGDYVASEADPGNNWTVDGNPSAKITVPANGAAASLVPTITNTRKHGSLVVTKDVDWNGTTPDPNATFEVCVTGPSFPTTADCKKVGSNGGKMTWSDLLPGEYTVTETDPGASWSVATVGLPAIVPADGGHADVSILNTHKPVEVLGKVLAKTGGEDTWPLTLAGLAIVAAAARRITRRRRLVV